MASRDKQKLPENSLERIQEEITVNNRELSKVERALEADGSNTYLLKKYDRLAKRDQILLEERKLWAGVALQNYSWHAGLVAAPGVMSMLSRMCEASQAFAETNPPEDIQQAMTAEQLAHPVPEGGRLRSNRARRYNTRRGLQSQHSDKAQLMLLADAADATGSEGTPSSFEAGPEPSGEPPRRGRPSKRRAENLSAAVLLPAAKRLAQATRFKPFHVAKPRPSPGNSTEEEAPSEVPIALNAQPELVEYFQDVMTGKPTSTFAESGIHLHDRDSEPEREAERPEPLGHRNTSIEEPAQGRGQQQQDATRMNADSKASSLIPPTGSRPSMPQDLALFTLRPNALLTS